MAALFTWLIEESILAILNLFDCGTSDGIVILFMGFFTIVYVGTVGKSKSCRPVADALIVGLLWRIALLLFDIYGNDIYLLPNSGKDSVGFFKHATAYATSNYESNNMFVITMGTIFKICGISRVNGQFLIMLCSMVSLNYGEKMMELLDVSIPNRRKTMWILCLLPNFAILSSIFLRESIVTMFITLAMYKYIVWMKKKKETAFILAIIYSFAGAAYHSGAIAIAVGLLISRIIYDNKAGRISVKFKNIFASAVILVAGVLVLNRYGNSFLGKFENLESISDVANESERGGSSYAQYVGNSNNPISMIIYTIPRIIFFLFSPMPWMIRGISDIIAFLFSSCYYLLVCVAFFRSILKHRTKDSTTSIILFIIIMAAVFVFAWGVSNTGTACRHRDKLTVLWGVLWAISLPERRKTYDRNSTVWSER